MAIPDFRERRDPALLQQLIAARAAEGQSQSPMNLISGITQGMQVADSINKIVERNRRNKAIASFLKSPALQSESPDIQEMVKTGVQIAPEETIKSYLTRKQTQVDPAEARRREDSLRRADSEIIDNISNYPSTLKKGDYVDQALRRRGLNIDAMTEYGAAKKRLLPDGSVEYSVVPLKEFNRRIEQKTWKEDEVKDFKNVVEENTRWNDVIDRAKELGISPNMQEAFKISFEDINSEVGPVSFPARIELVGQYAKDPKYTALKRSIEQAFQSFRKRITGAQASDKELRMLRDIMPKLTDNPAVFFESIYMLQDANNLTINEKLNMFESIGRDTSGISKYIDQFNKKTKERRVEKGKGKKESDPLGIR